jgi:hypothetical protein
METQFNICLQSKLNSLQLKKGLVYHYTVADALSKIIQNNSFWVSEKGFLNDISEKSYPFECRKELLAICNQPNMKDLLSFSDGMNKYKFYILSLSTEKDSLPLWSEYCSGKGYCLGFDINELITIFQERGIPFIHGKVIYKKDEQIKLIHEEVEYIRNIINEENMYKRLNDELDIVASAMASIDKLSHFFKKSVYHSENEYRFVFGILKKDGIKTNYREKNNAIIPYIEIDKLNKLPIKEIGIGPKNNIDIAKLSIDSLLQSKQYKNVDIWESEATLRY